MRHAANAFLFPFLIVSTGLLAAGSGHADVKEESAKKSALERSFDAFDKAFGFVVNKPLGAVLFYDLIPWDNRLKGQEVIDYRDANDAPLKVDGHVLKSFTEEKGYEIDDTRSVAGQSVLVVTKGARELTLGQVPVAVSGGPLNYKVNVRSAVLELSDSSNVDRVLFTEWTGKPFSPAPTPTEGETLYVYKNLGPFPVVVSERILADKTAVARRFVGHSATANVRLEPKVGDTVIVIEEPLNEAGSPEKVLSLKGENVVVGPMTTRYLPADQKIKNPAGLTLPFIVLWLIMGSLFFTLRMSFINFRGFKHAIEVVRGVFDNPEDEGEISHFQALSSALSATVGLGNIAGVAIAVSVGGPGAVFWMVVAGFLGMASKFVECTLGQMYRVTDSKGNVSGGPMRFLPQGLSELGVPKFVGIFMGGLFTVMCIGGSFGGGNMFQANQAHAAVSQTVMQYFELDITGAGSRFLFGSVLAILVGLVIIGGIQRIGKAASYLVPFMCGVYLLAGLVVLLFNVEQLPSAFGKIIFEAFSPQAGLGGLLGVLITGFRRAAFSNEAGVGSASIAHSAATTEEPVREGLVALLGPFIDTVVVCTMTGLVVVVTNSYQADVGDGVLMTSAAFGSVISWFPAVLSVAVLLFAFSTMISWSYYGERCFTLLFGEQSSMIYRVIFLVFVVFGCVIKLDNVLEFSDLMVLGMAFPNVLGCVLLSGKVRARLDDYWTRYKDGTMKRMK